jgi:hypothetical protein
LWLHTRFGLTLGSLAIEDSVVILWLEGWLSLCLCITLDWLGRLDGAIEGAIVVRWLGAYIYFSKRVGDSLGK